MYHKKKIGLFISHIFGDYQRCVCQGIVDYAADFGYQTEIYATTDGENLGDYGIGEESILRIPNYAEFSGIILASETYPAQDLKEKIIAKLEKSCSCPIVEITHADKHFPSVSLSNNVTAGELTEHFITVHAMKRIAFLGCQSETFFSDQRQRAYCEAMEKHHLAIGAKDIFQAEYSDASCEEALAFFAADGTMPEGIVCYNDRLALQFLIAAIKHGYQVPKDFALTGCDCTPEGQNINPQLTSVTFPVYELGQKACEQLLHLIQGDEISDHAAVLAKPFIARSCGCDCGVHVPTILYGQKLLDRIRSLESSMISSMRMSAGFSHITDLDDGMDLLEKYIAEIDHCSEFYLCLYDNWDALPGSVQELTGLSETVTQEFSSDATMHLKLALRNGKRLPECSFSKTALLPDFIGRDSSSAYLISPLFFENREFGYIALAYEENQINYPFQLVHWIMNITQLLQNICEMKRTQILTERLEELYMRDVLTGLYNHHGYQHYEKQLLQQAVSTDSFTAFLFDLDCLKTINDQFGHAEGDFALRVIGQALKNATKPEDICARFSGDEFFVLTLNYSKKTADDLIVRIQKYLDHYNKLNNKPYNISVSCGYASLSNTHKADVADLKALFSEADKKMYEMKTTKVKQVLRQ